MHGAERIVLANVPGYPNSARSPVAWEAVVPRYPNSRTVRVRGTDIAVRQYWRWVSKIPNAFEVAAAYSPGFRIGNAPVWAADRSSLPCYRVDISLPTMTMGEGERGEVDARRVRCWFLRYPRATKILPM